MFNKIIFDLVKDAASSVASEQDDDFIRSLAPLIKSIDMCHSCHTIITTGKGGLCVKCELKRIEEETNEKLRDLCE